MQRFLQRRNLYLVVFVLLAGGCNALLGIDSASVTPDGSAGAAGNASGGSGGQGGSAGVGGEGGGGSGQGGSGGQGVTKLRLSAGFAHTCAWVPGGRAQCWGGNDKGQLGNPDSGVGQENLSTTTPAFVVDSTNAKLTDILALESGTEFLCALFSDKRVACWGSNDKGQLGSPPADTGETTTAPHFVKDAKGIELGDVRAIGLGHDHGCALIGDGTVQCWGNNESGELGNPPGGSGGAGGAGGDGGAGGAGGAGGSTYTHTPLIAQADGDSLKAVTAIALGSGHSCALLTGGKVSCWGNNSNGQLGRPNDGSAPPNYLAAVVKLQGQELTGARSLALGAFHTCALVEGGQVLCWGRNVYGELGSAPTDSNDQTAHPIPTAVQTETGDTLSDVRALAKVRGNHTCAILENGSVSCWGRNQQGQLGNDSNVGTGTPNVKPTPVSNLSVAGPSVVEVVQGSAHTAALLSDGQVLTWGYNKNGQLGRNANEYEDAANYVLGEVVGLSLP